MEQVHLSLGAWDPGEVEGEGRWSVVITWATTSSGCVAPQLDANDASAGAGDRVAPGADCEVGDEVTADYRQLGSFLSARIVADNADGTFTVTWDDDSITDGRRVPASACMLGGQVCAPGKLAQKLQLPCRVVPAVRFKVRIAPHTIML